MNTIQGIQMIGTQRSGSNLLRVMLDGIREIAAPHPPHILQRFLPLLPKYGDLTDQSNFYRLAQDVCELVTVNPVPWEGITIRADEVVAACRQQTLYELFRVIYESAARQTGASFWLCKSMKNMLYAEGIESTGISPYYIYLYRDGRDVALSFKKAIVGEKHIYALAENWKKDQEAALRLKDRTAADHFFMLNYETLIASPEKVMRQAEKTPQEVQPADMEGRLDLRDVQMVTIDGEDAKDLDDAVSLTMEGDKYVLGVHIADVSNYVQEKSAMDREALKRGTSVYLVDRVIPMLPRRLSNGICSLNAGEDRLALSCIMTIDPKGNIVDHEIAETVIHVDQRMSYTGVQKILDGDEETVKKYEVLVPMLVRMKGTGSTSSGKETGKRIH